MHMTRIGVTPIGRRILAAAAAAAVVLLGGLAATASATIEVAYPTGQPALQAAIFQSNVTACLAAGLNSAPEIRTLIQDLAASPRLHVITYLSPARAAMIGPGATVALPNVPTAGIPVVFGGTGQGTGTVTAVQGARSPLGCTILVHELAHAWDLDRAIADPRPLGTVNGRPAGTRDDIVAVRTENYFRAWIKGLSLRFNYGGIPLPHVLVLVPKVRKHKISYKLKRVRRLEAHGQIIIGMPPAGAPPAATTPTGTTPTGTTPTGTTPAGTPPASTPPAPTGGPGTQGYSTPPSTNPCNPTGDGPPCFLQVEVNGDMYPGPDEEYGIGVVTVSPGTGQPTLAQSTTSGGFPTGTWGAQFNDEPGCVNGDQSVGECYQFEWFAPQTITLTAHPTPNGGYGTDEPDYDSQFAGWGGDCASAGDSPTCTLQIGSQVSVDGGYSLSVEAYFQATDTAVG